MTATIAEPAVFPIPLAGRRSWRSADSLRHVSLYAQGALALSYPAPTGLPVEPRAPRLAVVRDGDEQLPGSPEAWTVTFLHAVIEVIACDRPLAQLVRWTSRAVYADIARKRGLVARHRSMTSLRPSRQRLATVRVSHPNEVSAEVAARLTVGTRSRALAARFDYQNDRWVCTALCFG
jgi:hypothetical protein